MDELRAFLFGATLASAVGPIALLVIHNGMRHGPATALASAAGVAAADFAYALAGFAAGTGIAAALEQSSRLFSAAAGALLVGLGLWLAFTSARSGSSRAAAVSARAGFAATFLLTLANPLTIVLFAGFSAQLSLASGWTQAAYFAAFVFAGSLPVQIAYALLGAAARRVAPDPRLVRGLNIASGGGIALFGLYGLLRAL